MRSPDSVTTAAQHLPRAHVADAEPVLVRQIFSEVAKRRHDPAPLLRGLGFGPDELESADFRISYTQTSRVVRRALRLLEQPELGVFLGATFNPVSWGFCLVGLLASADSHDMLRFAVDAMPTTGRFLKLSTQSTGRGLAVLAEDAFDEPDVADFLVENTFASLARVARHVIAPAFGPLAVEFRMPRPPSVALHEQVFRCPLHFGCERGRMLFPTEAQAVPSADPLVAGMCRRFIDLQRGGDGRVASELEEAILRALRGNLREPPSMQSIAATINLSERTLRRRLTQSDLSYATLLDSERMRRALSLVTDRRVSLAHVAAEAGFADVRSLRRAIKRWTGQTPAQMRRRED